MLGFCASNEVAKQAQTARVRVQTQPETATACSDTASQTQSWRFRGQTPALSSVWIPIVLLKRGVLVRHVSPRILLIELHPLATELRQGGRAVHRDLDRLLTGGLLAP